MEVHLIETRINYSLLKKSKLTFRRGSREKSIFHYTSIYGLQGILSKKSLHFTNINYMNDKDEIIAGLESFGKDSGVFEKQQSELRSILSDSQENVFVCCFSLDNDSLPMWNYYTKEINNQGFNIEFSDKKLVESLLRLNPGIDGCNFSFGTVDYSKDNNSEYSRIILTEIDRITKNWFSNLLNPKLTEEEKGNKKRDNFSELPIYFYNGQTCSFGRSNVESFLYYIKRDYFNQEQEFRIVITVPKNLLSKLKEKEIYKFRISNGALVPYLELKFSEEVVKSIMISPTVKSDLIELSIKDFLEYSNFNVQDFSTFIKHSEIPVRF